MSRPKTSKTLIITDDEEVQTEDQNPFSFREFLRWKDQDQDQSLRSRDLLVGDFLSEASLAPQEEQEEAWGRSFQSGVDSTSSLCTEEEEEEEEEETRFCSRPEDQHQRGGENYEGDDETSMAEPGSTSCRRRRNQQVQQLQEENMALRRTLREVQRKSDANERRVQELSEELLQRRRQEEKEAQDLESMVQSVEQNLHLMTKRALKAESCVSRSRAELQQLQEQVETLRSENQTLRAAESQVVMAMRQNAHTASEYLDKTTSHAQSSIRQLMEEAESLRLVSQMLRSIDRIHTES